MLLVVRKRFSLKKHLKIPIKELKGKFMRKLSRLRKKSGQGTTEYLLIVGVLVAVIVVFGDSLKKRMSGVVDSLFGGIDSKVKTLTK